MDFIEMPNDELKEKIKELQKEIIRKQIELDAKLKELRELEEKNK